MRFSSNAAKGICSSAIACLFLEIYFFVLAPLPTPSVPETSVAQAATVPEAVSGPSFPDPRQLVQDVLNGDDYPVRLIAPTIKLDAHVEHMGINAKGEMDVPDGSSAHVGWYKYGTLPGNTGSAVIDAHVYAAFKKLKYVKVGDSLFVTTKSGKRLHFRVEDSRVYKTEEVPAQLLFNRSDAKRLNLITCAGTYRANRGTYDHRLIVYAVLVEEQSSLDNARSN